MLDRRAVLVLAGRAAVTAACGTLVACSSPDSRRDARPLPEGVDSTVLAALVAVGRAHLERHPEDADIQRLAGRLELDPDVLSIDQVGAVRASARADFVADRVVEVDGWVLSRTEAQLAALVALGAEQ